MPDARAKTRSLGGGTFSTTDWKNPGSVRAFVQEVLREKERDNWEWERQADLNLAWYKGHQMLMYSKSTRRLHVKPNPNRRVRLIANVIQPLADGWVSKINLDKIKYDVRPATDDFEDHDTAQFSRGFLQYYQKMLDFDRKVPLADKWACLTGEAYLKATWDPGAGGEIEYNDEDLEGITDKRTRERIAAEGVQYGDCCVSVVSPFNIWWGPQVEFDDADYVIEIYDRSKSYVRARYPEISSEALAEAETDKMRGRVWRSADTTSFGTRDLNDDPEVIQVAVLWCRRNRGIKGLEMGHHSVHVGEATPVFGENPYKHREIPIVQIRMAEVPGNQRGITPVTDVLPLQADINRNISQQTENRELMANPVWLAQHGSVLDDDEWVARPGGIRSYRGVKPELVNGVPMPDQVTTQLMQSMRFAQDLIGLRDVSQAKNPPNVRSGRAILALREADDERLNPYAQRRRRAWQRVGQWLLQIGSQFINETRMMRIMGDEDDGRVARFSGDMLTGQNTGPGVNYYDVVVQTSGFNQSPAAQQENVIQLASQGFLRPDDPKHQRLVFEILGMQNDARFGVDPNRDARETQRRRNEIMLRGGYEPPNEWERHEILLEELQSFMEKVLSRPGFDRSTLPQFQKYEADVVGMMAIRQMRMDTMIQSAMAKFQQSQNPQQMAGQRMEPQAEGDAPPLTQTPMT